MSFNRIPLTIPDNCSVYLCIGSSIVRLPYQLTLLYSSHYQVSQAMKVDRVFLFFTHYCHNICCLHKLLLNEVFNVFLKLIYPPTKTEELKYVFGLIW